jgi:hypothetical protein
LSYPDVAQHRFVPKTRNPNGPFDPWELREDFLNWPDAYWETFVDMAGSFGTFRLSKRDFVEWQALLREALVRPPNKWWEMLFDTRKVDKLFMPLPVTFEWNELTPLAVVRTGRTLQAIIATIQLDKLHGSEFRICARSDCKNAPFKIEARHKIYCTPACAHLVAVRNSRGREARSKGTKIPFASKRRSARANQTGRKHGVTQAR